MKQRFKKRKYKDFPLDEEDFGSEFEILENGEEIFFKSGERIFHHSLEPEDGYTFGDGEKKYIFDKRLGTYRIYKERSGE